MECGMWAAGGLRWWIAAVLLGTVIYEDLTMLIFALAALLAGAYAATLPETRGRPSVQTVSELRC